MKKLVAILMLLAFTASAAEPYVPLPPPLLPVAEAPLPVLDLEKPVPGYARWWVWAIAGTATAQTVGVFLFMVLVVIPGFAPRPVDSSSPR